MNEVLRTSPREAATGRSPAVLVVDDEADLRELLSLTLLRLGLDVDTAESVGSTAMTRTPGTSALSTRPTPVMVPPVPTPATKAAMDPPVSARISRAVVRSWTWGLAGLLNC